MPLPPLTETARAELRRIARTTRDVRLLRRAQAVLDLDGGDSPDRVARRYQVSRSTVYNWAARLAEAAGPSEEALRDRPRPGRPRRLKRPSSEGARAGAGGRGMDGGTVG